MTRFLKLTGLFVLLSVFVAGSAYAQDWRGMGRMGGKVVDEDTGQGEKKTPREKLPRTPK